MFLYRPILLNKSPRMLIAVLLAIAIHLGLMSFKFTSGPVIVPDVSLPRSVSIMLKKKNLAESPLRQTAVEEEKAHTGNKASRSESKPQLPTIKEPVPEPETVIESVPTQVASEKKIQVFHDSVTKIYRESVQEKVDHGLQEITENNTASESTGSHPDKAEESAIQTDARVSDEVRGAPTPGVLQIAYPRYNLNAPPAYPYLARKRGQQGTVVLQALVNKEGRVDDLRVDISSGYAQLDRAALTAVKNWLFEPGRKGDDRQTMWVRVPVTFKLKN